MKILITGGAGFIGSNFVRRIFQGPYADFKSVIVLDNLTYAGNMQNLESVKHNSNFRFVKGDICDSELLNKIIQEIDGIINFAAESHVDRSINNSHDFVNTNVMGVRNILDCALNSQRKIKFLQVSTDEVYGSIEDGSWDEGYPVMPNSPYSASKASADLLVRAYVHTHQVDAVVTRCSNNYGPYQNPEKLIPLFVTNLLDNKKVPIYGNGSNVRDWLHVDDHCDGIYLAFTKGKSGEIYNIGGGKELSNLEITNAILDEMQLSDEFIEYVQDRKGHDYRYSINCKKITDELGYRPKVDFISGMKSTISWYRENRSWWEPLKKL